MKANVIVRLKAAVHDPQGETIRRALEGISFDKVRSVSQGKFFELSLDVSSKEEAKTMARQIGERVLSNSVLEIFDVEVES